MLIAQCDSTVIHHVDSTTLSPHRIDLKSNRNDAPYHRLQSGEDLLNGKSIIFNANFIICNTEFIIAKTFLFPPTPRCMPSTYERTT